MACCGGSITLSDQERFGVYTSTPCTAITVDLLQVYKRGIDCYLRNKLWSRINSNEQEMLSAESYLQDFIDRKIADPNDCTGIESLYLIRVLFDKIVKIGVCI